MNNDVLDGLQISASGESCQAEKKPPELLALKLLNKFIKCIPTWKDKNFFTEKNLYSHAEHKRFFHAKRQSATMIYIFFHISSARYCLN